MKRPIAALLASLTLALQPAPGLALVSADTTTPPPGYGNAGFTVCKVGGVLAFCFYPAGQSTPVIVPIGPANLANRPLAGAIVKSGGPGQPDAAAVISDIAALLGSGIASLGPYFGVGVDSATPLLPYGGFSAQSALSGNTTGPHQTSIATRVIAHTGDGSGQNGPATADYAQHLFSGKNNWLSTTIDGEFDGGYVITRQGRKGDLGGLLFDNKKVLSGTSDDSGGITPIEGEAGWVAPDGTPLSQMHWIPGFVEGAGGLSGSTGYGNFVASGLGNQYAGHISMDLNAFPGKAYGFLNAFAGCRSGTGLTKDAFCYYRVAGATGRTGNQQPGDTYQGGTPGQQTITRTDTSGTWHLRNATDTADLLKVDQTGQTTLADGSTLQGVATYTPTVTCGNGGSFGSNGVSASGEYTAVGKLVSVVVSISISNIGSCGGYLIVSKPPTGAISLGAVLPGLDTGTSHALTAQVGGDGTMYVKDYAGAFPFANGTTVLIGNGMFRQ